MIRRWVMLLAVCGMCVSLTADAADLPSFTPKRIAAPEKKAPKLQKRAAKPSSTGVATRSLPKIAPKEKKASLDPVDVDMNLVWVLEPLIANSDGAKREDSASVEANLVVTDAGRVSQSDMTIELTGHVVKTTRTTARIDIRIGNSNRTISWDSDDVLSGKFQISLNQPMSTGQLPDYFPVSALAFVTKEGKDGAAMVSLEKVVVRMGKIQLTGAKKNPATSEVTGSLSAN
jgi:hypothetical protein